MNVATDDGWAFAELGRLLLTCVVAHRTRGLARRGTRCHPPTEALPGAAHAASHPRRAPSHGLRPGPSRSSEEEQVNQARERRQARMRAEGKSVDEPEKLDAPWSYAVRGARTARKTHALPARRTHRPSGYRPRGCDTHTHLFQNTITLNVQLIKTHPSLGVKTILQ